MKRLMVSSLLLTLLATLLFSADITGKWKGQLTGADRDRDLTFDLVVKGEAVTGTVSGVLDHALEIKDGKVQGDTVSFWVPAEYQGQSLKLKYSGQISGSEIRFTLSLEEGTWSTTLVAKKTS
jgi:hypothetical protein